MSCRPNRSPDSAKVWLLHLPNDLSLHILRFIHGLLFSTAVYFPFFSPSISSLSTTPQFSVLLHTTSLFAFCFFFPIYLCSAPTSTFTYACAQNYSRQNPQFSMAYVSNTYSTSTSWYGSLACPSLSRVTSRPFCATIVGGPA